MRGNTESYLFDKTKLLTSIFASDSCFCVLISERACVCLSDRSADKALSSSSCAVRSLHCEERERKGGGVEERRGERRRGQREKEKGRMRRRKGGRESDERSFRIETRESEG